MRYWLLKSEGDCYSIDDLQKDKQTAWTGIRNYQARNFMRDDMKKGDLALFYHSSSKPNGVYGIAKVTALAHADPTQFDKKDDHYDPKSKKENPQWVCVDVAFVKKFKEPVSLEEIKHDPHLDGMMVRATGSRLSVQPVSEKHYHYIVKEMTK
ncbi:MAG TPA: EVE domain-containing protein [Candidatus Paceibacterota bacterium]|jgi:predicted RNA-binding protein with PUA-like domain|nr:EVE domain-containing protein [Candidatus Paceibacterota bacterium]